MIVLRKKLFSYHIDCMDSDGKRYILPVKKDPETGKEITSPHRIYYNPDGSVTVKDDKTGKVVKELPARKEKKFSWFSFGTKKISYKVQIEESFGWALDYMDYINDLVERENNRLDLINPEISQYFRFTEPANNICDITDFIADFNNNKYWVGSEISPKYIKYDPESDKLYLRSGYPIAYAIDHSKDPIIREIKTRADLGKACKEHFQELLKNLMSVGFSKFENYCTGGDEDVLEECGGSEGIKKYYMELQRSVKTILSKIK